MDNDQIALTTKISTVDASLYILKEKLDDIESFLCFVD